MGGADFNDIKGFDCKRSLSGPIETKCIFLALSKQQYHLPKTDIFPDKCFAAKTREIKSRPYKIKCSSNRDIVLTAEAFSRTCVLRTFTDKELASLA